MLYHEKDLDIVKEKIIKNIEFYKNRIEVLEKENGFKRYNKLIHRLKDYYNRLCVDENIIYINLELKNI